MVILKKPMKRIIASLIMVCVLAGTAFSLFSQSCEVCLSGHSSSSDKCHTQSIPNLEEKSCHSETSTDSCDTNDSSSTDCQICFHSSDPLEKIGTVTTLTMEKQFFGLATPQNHFSNQIPPPILSKIYSVSSPPTLANHLTLLDPIRLLI